MELKRKVRLNQQKPGFTTLTIPIETHELLLGLKQETGYPIYQLMDMAIKDFKANLKLLAILILTLTLQGCLTFQGYHSFGEWLSSLVVDAETTIHDFPAGTLVITDDDVIFHDECLSDQGRPRKACYVRRTQTLYCHPTSLSSCTHELLHHAGLDEMQVRQITGE